MKPRVLIALVLVLAAATNAQRSGAPIGQLSGPYRVERVSDGDTVRLASLGSVRLIGIDTPETYASSKLDKDVAQSGLSREEMMFDKEKLLSVFDHTVQAGTDPVRTKSGKLGPASELLPDQGLTFTSTAQN